LKRKDVEEYVTIIDYINKESFNLFFFLILFE